MNQNENGARKHRGGRVSKKAFKGTWRNNLLNIHPGQEQTKTFISVMIDIEGQMIGRIVGNCCK